MRKRNIIVSVAVSLSALALSSFIIGRIAVPKRVRPSGHAEAEVHYVVPDGYTGYFWIVKRADGDDVLPTKGVYNIVVPPNGVKCVKDTHFLSEWHRESASYISGRKLCVEHFDHTVDSDTCIRPLGASSKGVHYFIVGTATEAKLYQANVGESLRADLLLRKRLDE